MHESLHISSAVIKSEAQRLGFSAYGITRADAVEDSTWSRFTMSLAQGRHAQMHYLENYQEKRRDPRLLVEEAKSIICVALNYTPKRQMMNQHYQLAWYAYGKDYHEVVRNKLNELLTRLRTQYGEQLKGRAFCDTAPVLERYWAQKAGLGWQGKHTQLVIPNLGSSFFLGELIINATTEYDASFEGDRCGSCTRCLDACPTQAIAPHKPLDAARCLSYLTIEHRGEIPIELANKVGRCIYGCDRCLQACPHQRHAQPSTISELQPSVELMAMTRQEWHDLTQERYQRLFKGSAVKRAKFEGLMRNIRLANTDCSQEED